MSSIKQVFNDGKKVHRLNPEETFDLTLKSKFWKKTLLNYEESDLGENKRKGNYETKKDNST
jgi:hypothetical protein